MPRVEVKVSPRVLSWALVRSRKEITIQKKFPKIREWLRGESMPTLRQLEQLAKETHTPLGYFFLEEPPVEQLPIPYFRTTNNGSTDQQISCDLFETVQTMKLRQNWMREYLIDVGQEPLRFVGSAKLEDDPQQVAMNIRKTLELEEGWTSYLPSWTATLKFLRSKMEDIGIIVVVNSIVGNNTRRKLVPEEFRGFVLVDEYAPLVFVNGADSKAAQMFTLAHELAHLWFGSSAAFDLRELRPANNKIEQICNMVAAEFLVPQHELQQIWPSVRNKSEPFQALARHFKVSELVVARRTLDLGYITKNEFIEFYEDYLSKERSSTQDNGGGDFYENQNARIGRRFAEAVISAVRTGKLLYREAYELTGLYGSTFDKYAEFLGFGGFKQ